MALSQPIALFSPLSHRGIGDDTAGGPQMLMLDAVLEEEEEHTNEMEEHPIEVPAENASSTVRGRVADHVYREPTTYIMRATVSDFPVTWKNFQGYGNSLLTTRSQGAYDLLMEHFNRREPFELVTRWGSLQNMVLLRLTIPNRNDLSASLEFTARLREAQIVITNETADAEAEEVEGEQAETGAVPEVDRGDVALAAAGAAAVAAVALAAGISAATG